MRKKNEFFIYTCMWVIALAILMVLLMQNLGDARIVNYSGIVRGATQKLVKEEMSGQQDDALLLRLDQIIDNLRTGQGEFDLRRNGDKDYQSQLALLEQTWDEMKTEIHQVRRGETSPLRLYELSQRHFAQADEMVLLAEQGAERKLIRFIVFYGVVLLISVCVFTLLNRKNRRALENSIYTDNLTGILNRAGFEANAAPLLRQRPGGWYCLIELDIDDFKFLNSSYGYELGDKLLCALADALRERYHSNQLCARISADDFLILARQEPDLVDGLRSLLAKTLLQGPLLNVSEFVTFTVGAYAIPENAEVIQSVMDKANMAHKDAKLLGKSTTVWYNEKLLDKLNHENKLKNRLRRALDGGEFKMYLQPKFSLSDLSFHSAEALVRWDIPGHGIVAPDDFIPLFERNGSIAEVDFCMLDKACAFIRRHMDRYGGEFSIAVNLSRVTIYQQRFYPAVLEIVDRYRLPHRCIELEITESAFNETSDVLVKKLLQLQDAGFVVTMDDFGSGYSSLNLLDTLPIQVLKLDRGFLREYGVSDRVKNVLACVTELAHALNIRLVCEGIEQREHVAFLQEIGCDYGQGFFFSKPVPQEEFVRRYAAGKA